jgi:hypothetical protein
MSTSGARPAAHLAHEIYSRASFGGYVDTITPRLDRLRDQLADVGIVLGDDHQGAISVARRLLLSGTRPNVGFFQ